MLENIKINVKEIKTEEKEINVEEFLKEKNIEIKLPTKIDFKTQKQILSEDGKEILQIISTNASGTDYMGNVEVKIADQVFVTFSLLRKKEDDGHKFYFITPFKKDGDKTSSFKPSWPRTAGVNQWNGIDQKSYTASGSGEEVVQSTIFMPYETLAAIKAYVSGYAEECEVVRFVKKETKETSSSSKKDQLAMF